MRVALVEDDAAVAASLQALLSSWGIACDHYPSGEAFLGATDDPPSCVLLDIRLPGMDGLEVLKTLRRKDQQTPVIVMTGHGDVSLAVDALRNGAQDFLEKPFDGEALIARLKSEVEKAVPDILCRQKLDTLTPRETDVLRGVVAGHQNKIIAHELGISQKTVELHRSRVMDKTGSRSVSQLIQIALRGGLQPEGEA